jgi:hypothetical protein
MLSCSLYASKVCKAQNKLDSTQNVLRSLLIAHHILHMKSGMPAIKAPSLISTPLYYFPPIRWLEEPYVLSRINAKLPSTLTLWARLRTSLSTSWRYACIGITCLDVQDVEHDADQDVLGSMWEFSSKLSWNLCRFCWEDWWRPVGLRHR